MIRRILWTISLTMIFFSLVTVGDSKELDFLVQWKEDCVAAAFIGEELTEDISAVPIRDVGKALTHPCAEQVERDRVVSVATNDTRFNEQWALKNTGQTIGGQKGVSGRDIGFVEGYNKIRSTPQGNTVVAVVDTGVTSINELSGRLTGGRNIINNNTNVTDENGHGTFIASLIASRVGNGAGIAGVNDRVRIMPVKVLDETGTGLLSNLIIGMQYAIDNNAHIINLSLVTNYTSSLDSIIERAHNRGVIVIAATGNEGKNLNNSRVSPVNNDGNGNWVIGVGSHNNRGDRSDFSNFGVGTDVLAPGEAIVGMDVDNTVAYRSGTSAAAAIATGVVASWRDYYGKLTPVEAQNLIQSYSVGGRISMSRAMVSRNYPNGMLIKSPTSGVFLLQQGLRRPIISPQVFLAHNFDWNHIVTISQSDFDRIPMGSALPLRDGTLVADSQRVYLIENQQKRAIASAQAFLQMGYSWSNIWQVDSGVLNLHPTGAIIGPEQRIPNGTIVSAPGTGVYLIEGQRKRPIPDPFTYLTHFRWEQVIQVSRARLDVIPNGSQLLPREGTIIANTQTVFFIEGNTRRPFASANAYLGLGLSWDRVQTPGNAVVGRFSVGNPIQ